MAIDLSFLSLAKTASIERYIMKKLWKRLTQIYTIPDPVKKARRELVESKLKLMEAVSGVQYAQSMVNYNTQRIESLENFIARETALKHPSRPAK